MMRTSPSHKRPLSVLVVFAFIRRNDELLLVERALPPFQGMRTIPGGHKQYGEEYATACLREMREETGLVLEDLRFAGLMQVHRERPGEEEYLCLYYVADTFSGTLTPSHEGPLAWEKMADIHTMPGTHPALRALLPFVEKEIIPFTAEAYCDTEGRGIYTVTPLGANSASVTNRYE